MSFNHFIAHSIPRTQQTVFYNSTAESSHYACWYYLKTNVTTASATPMCHHAVVPPRDRFTTSCWCSATPVADVVDKSVHLLGTKNRISLSDFFERLKKLNLDKHAGRSQVDDNAYCTAKRKWDGPVGVGDNITDMYSVDPNEWGPRLIFNLRWMIHHWTVKKKDFVTYVDNLLYFNFG